MITKQLFDIILGVTNVTLFAHDNSGDRLGSQIHDVNAHDSYLPVVLRPSQFPDMNLRALLSHQHMYHVHLHKYRF
jgi:hypothetical protein